VWNIVFQPTAPISEIQHQVLTERVVALQTEVLSAKPSPDGKSILMEKRKVTAVPYYVWANRGPNSMQVWLPTTIKDIKINYTTKYEDGGNY